MHRRLKRRLVVGATVIAAAAFAGGAYAASGDSTPSPRQAFLADVAKRLGVPESKLDQALRAAFLDQIQRAVKEGKLTQAEANQIKQRIKNRPAPLFGFGAGALLGPPGLLGPRALIGPPGALPLRPLIGPPGLKPGPLAVSGGLLGEAAGYLGLSRTQLLRQLQGGRSLSQIASAQGKSVSGLENTLAAALKSKLDKAVAAKRITSAQEQRLLTRMKAAMGFLINRPWPVPGRLVHPGFGPRFRPGFGPGAPPGAPRY